MTQEFDQKFIGFATLADQVRLINFLCNIVIRLIFDFKTVNSYQFLHEMKSRIFFINHHLKRLLKLKHLSQLFRREYHQA